MKALAKGLGAGVAPGADVRRKPMPRATEDRVGAVGVDFLDELTAWAPQDRPTAASCLGHPFVDVGPLRCIGDARAFPGRRHSWQLVKGYMEPELLCWLRAEADEKLEVWKAGAMTARRLEPKAATNTYWQEKLPTSVSVSP